MTVPRLYFDREIMRSFPRFGDALEAAIRRAGDDTLALTPLPDAPDAIGRHWYGMRCSAEDLPSGRRFYLHIGLIYHPDTRAGLMVEADKKNNTGVFDAVWNHIPSSSVYEINRDEPDYFKLFMPEADFEALNTKKRTAQVETLAAFVSACAKGIARACEIEDRGFSLTVPDLHNARALLDAFRQALAEGESENCRISVNEKDKDNIGRYAEGFRYDLTDVTGGHRMYAYFGAIYSDKKDPAGIFAEIDAFSNPDIFAQVEAHFTEVPDAFTYSRKEKGFIKLFMTEEDSRRFNGASPEEQRKMLARFLMACNESLMRAAKA